MEDMPAGKRRAALEAWFSEDCQRGSIRIYCGSRLRLPIAGAGDHRYQEKGCRDYNRPRPHCRHSHRARSSGCHPHISDFWACGAAIINPLLPSNRTAPYKDVIGADTKDDLLNVRVTKEIRSVFGSRSSGTWRSYQQSGRETCHRLRRWRSWHHPQQTGSEGGGFRVNRFRFTSGAGLIGDQATASRPFFLTRDRSFRDAPEGFFSPRSHLLIRLVVTFR